LGANAHVARVLTARVSFEDLCVLILFACVDGGGRTNALPFVRARGAKVGFAIDEAPGEFWHRCLQGGHVSRHTFCDFCFFT
jgi:hypothetical protein